MAQKVTKQKTKLDAKTIIERKLKTARIDPPGMVGGNMAGKLIHKVVKVDDSASGFQAKALLKPVVQISAGVGGSLLLKDQNLKLIACGVAASGIASTVKVFLKKDILQGLTNFAGLGDYSDAVKSVFREPVNLSISPYNPDLPQLPPSQMAALPIEQETDFSGAFRRYTEIKSVEIL